MERLVSRLAQASALLGGVVLVALILMTCASIAGRALSGFGLGPVPGDFELVEAGVAFSVFCFLPIAQVKAGHATVDIFTSGMPASVNRFLLALWEIVMALAFALIAWRLLEGARAKYGYGETTLLLQFPLWWAYTASLVPAVATVVVAAWSAADRVRSALTGVDRRAFSGGADH